MERGGSRPGLANTEKYEPPHTCPWNTCLSYLLLLMPSGHGRRVWVHVRPLRREPCGVFERALVIAVRWLGAPPEFRVCAT